MKYKKKVELYKRKINNVKILRTMSKSCRRMNGFKRLVIQYGKSLSVEFEDKRREKTIEQRLDM